LQQSGVSEREERWSVLYIFGYDNQKEVPQIVSPDNYFSTDLI